jgi:hypothetical protein
MLSAALLAAPSATQAQSLPTDAKATCTVTPTQFNGWFQSGSVALDGAVNPANGVTFNDVNNCSFYRWAMQMFLWVTSPAGGGEHIFDSPTFYDVSAADASGMRMFQPHGTRLQRLFNLRAAKVGPDGLPVIFDRAGKMFEVRAAVGAPVIHLRSGAAVEIANARIGAGNNLVLQDKAGATIHPAPARQSAEHAISPPVPVVSEFRVSGIPIFIDAAGNVIDVGPGQAKTGGVLEAQTTQGGSLVYYATIVNDVFAYYRTSLGQTAPSGALFPTTQAELAKITNFAANAAPPNNKTFPDPDALTVELKTAWVEAAGLPNLSSYITTTATIPTYDTKTNPNSIWTMNGTKTVQLALVGLHVVGSVNGHPEMIWATFEHFGNAPSGSYSYIPVNGPPKTIAPSPPGAGTWLFASANATGPSFNQMLMKQKSTDIVVVPPPHMTSGTMGPSDTMRWLAFGAASNVKPNPEDPTAADSNSEIISINNSVSAQMPSGDVRNNYFMLGATWTDGFKPTGPFPQGNEVGTSLLANATMETYDQGKDNTNAGAGGCFNCHDINSNVTSPLATTALSHVFNTLKPLF